jgi:hypothetical protein
MVPAGCRWQDQGYLPPSARVRGLGEQAWLDVCRQDPQVLHDQVGPGKDPGVQALQDKGLLRTADRRNQKSVIDDALAVSLDGPYPALGSELGGDFKDGLSTED